MATAFPTPAPDDVWGAQLVQATKDYADGILGAPTLVLGPQDPIPGNTPAGTIIFRTT